MKTKIFVLIALLATLVLGFLLGQSSDNPDASSSNVAAGEDEILYWVAPMDANFRRDKPGLSPMGMDLIPVYANEQSSEEFGVSISPATTQNLGVRTAVASVQPWTEQALAVGEVAWDGSQVRKLYARSNGWLESLELNSVGQALDKGDLLYGLYAPQLVTAQEEYLQALKSGQTSLIRNSHKRLLALGFSRPQAEVLKQRGKPSHLSEYRVDQDAVVLSLTVAEGSYVTPTTEIATLANTEQVWIEAYLPESKATAVKIGDPVTVTFAADSTRTASATLDYIYPEINRRTRTVKVRAVLPNPQRHLKAGMFAKLRIHTQQDEALQIPNEAVIRTRDGNRVMVAQGNGQFSVKLVQLGAENAGAVVVLDGLSEGDLVVTSGQFLLDSEANGQQAIARLNALRTASGTATILGFPRRGKIRLMHDPIESLQWPAMNMVFGVANHINLMPFNKQDHVSFQFKEEMDGDWTITSIEKTQGKPPSTKGGTNHEGMGHD